MSNENRVAIHLNPPLALVMEALPPGQSLSKRLGLIADRYAMLLKNATVTVSDDEAQLLRTVLKGRLVTPAVIVQLDDEILSTEAADHTALLALADKMAALSITERCALLEKLAL